MFDSTQWTRGVNKKPDSTYQNLLAHKLPKLALASQSYQLDMRVPSQATTTTLQQQTNKQETMVNISHLAANA